MDALVALGDNAATTATEIGNAMQKCAAAAKVAGVSYSELTPMLATMTSMTQLSGKQVGTAMNTILTRLHNVTANNYTKEINGEVTSLNDVEKALGTIGVSLRDDDGGWRKSTDVLLDIAERWQSMTDIQKSLVSTSVAATRSGNMFQTLMEGMSEDGGKQFEEYLNLAENSEGITNKKYEVSVRSLSAAIDTLTSSYDRFVAGIESSKIGQTALDFVSSILNGFTTLTEE
jgi:TP901 family phage tail tape measure protein